MLPVLLGTLLGVRATAAQETPERLHERPNVLLILAEGLGPQLGCYGRPVETPQLDRLAKRGRRFANAFAQYPASSAARVSLLTGLRPDRLQVYAPPKKRPAASMPIQKRFQKAGYYAARVGRAYGGEAEALLKWGRAEDAAEPDAVVRRATEILGEKRSQPLFLVVGLDARSRRPVSPRTAAEVKRVDAGNELGLLPEIAASLATPDRPGRFAKLPARAEAEVRELLTAQYARAREVDAQLGPLLDSLDRHGLWGRTVVVFAGDQGADLGGHGVLQRPDMLFDDVLRVPLILATPSTRTPGTQSEAIVELVDVYPTLMALCGLPAEKGLDGASLEPALADPRASPKVGAFSVVTRSGPHLGRSVRTDRFRFNEWPDGSRELYDHERDPHEVLNLARDLRQAETVAWMKTLLEARAAATPPPPPVPVRAASRPNVLLLILDDLSVRLGSYGYDVLSPNIDRLAARGRQFERAYAGVSTCSPSRTSFLTGWRPEHVRVWGNRSKILPKIEGATPLHALFKANGYYTARAGKIFHQSSDPLFKWDEVVDLGGLPEDEADEPAEEPGGVDVSHWFVETNRADRDEPDGRKAELVAKLLGTHRDKPFFVAVGFSKPHTRWVAPKKYFDLYKPETLKIVQDPFDDLDDVPRIALARSAVERPGLFETGNPLEYEEPMRRLLTAAHHATVSFVDAQVGVLLDALDRQKLWDNTIVVLLGDHGYHLGEHRVLWRKDTLFEESLRTPLIVAPPGLQEPGVPTSALTELTDLYPTLAELAGLSVPTGIDGRSLVPYLRKPLANGPVAAYSFRECATAPLGRTVRTAQYRFTEWPDGARELYDLAADPGEHHNVAGEPARAAQVEKFVTLLYSVVESDPSPQKRRARRHERRATSGSE